MNPIALSSSRGGQTEKTLQNEIVELLLPEKGTVKPKKGPLTAKLLFQSVRDSVFWCLRMSGILGSRKGVWAVPRWSRQVFLGQQRQTGLGQALQELRAQNSSWKSAPKSWADWASGRKNLNRSERLQEQTYAGTRLRTALFHSLPPLFRVSSCLVICSGGKDWQFSFSSTTAQLSSSVRRLEKSLP